MTPPRVSFSDHVRAAAERLGFDAVGIACAKGDLERDFAQYERFIEAGMHGEMAWLAEHGTERARLDGDGILPGAESVICVARRYSAERGAPAAAQGAAGADDGGHGPGGSGIASAMARYARGRDYHGFLRKRLRRLAAFVRRLGTDEHPVRARPLLDEHPVLERAWAARAGLGFVGKNGMLIVPGVGSFVLLGEVVTTLRLDEFDSPIGERCGACTRCLDACPTSAFVAPFVLDPRRCVAYLTIEHRGPVPTELREGVGGHLFGCDDCQTVCPFNATNRARAPRRGSASADPFAPLDRWSRVPLEALLKLDEAGWTELSSGSPLKRAGRVAIARNAAIVLGNRRDVGALGALRAAARDHDDAQVRDAAGWAIARIERASEG